MSKCLLVSTDMMHDMMEIYLLIVHKVFFSLKQILKLGWAFYQ